MTYSRLQTVSALAAGVLMTLAGSALGGEMLLDETKPLLGLDLASAYQAPPADASATASAAQPAASAAATSSAVPVTGQFLFSNERFHSDPVIFWPGFLSGLRGFENGFDPIGNPLYFETPYNNTSVRLLFLHHDFSPGSQLKGGYVNVYAAQARIAVTERLGIIATKDGYSQLRADILPNDEGWNDIALGAKYALIADRENDFVLTPGLRWQWRNGDKSVLQGISQELSPFISLTKGFGNLHFVADFTYRFHVGSDKGNDVAQWDVSTFYDLSDLGLKGLAPVFEVHGLHYTSNGKYIGLSVGGLDYTNLGAGDVSGSSVVWLGVGARWKLTPQVSIGSTFEFAVTNRNADIMDRRVTADITLTW